MSETSLEGRINCACKGNIPHKTHKISAFIILKLKKVVSLRSQTDFIMIKSYLSKIFASIVKKKIDRWAKAPIDTQQKVFQSLIEQAKNTAFGRDHHFEEIKTYQDFVARVPIREIGRASCRERVFRAV